MRFRNGEMASFLSVAVVAGGILLAFPIEAFFRLRPSAAERGGASAQAVAFVVLDRKTETALVQSAKDTWRKRGGSDRFYADLVYVDLPESRPDSVLTIESRRRPDAPALAEGGVLPFLPSRGAAKPRQLPTDGDPPPLAFPREELLKIN